jgi:hypothetical protein
MTSKMSSGGQDRWSEDKWRMRNANGMMDAVCWATVGTNAAVQLSVVVAKTRDVR